MPLVVPLILTVFGNIWRIDIWHILSCPTRPVPPTTAAPSPAPFAQSRYCALQLLAIVQYTALHCYRPRIASRRTSTTTQSSVVPSPVSAFQTSSPLQLIYSLKLILLIPSVRVWVDPGNGRVHRASAPVTERHSNFGGLAWHLVIPGDWSALSSLPLPACSHRMRLFTDGYGFSTTPDASCASAIATPQCRSRNTQKTPLQVAWEMSPFRIR